LAEKHFHEQKKHTNTYLIPYFQKHLPNFKNLNVLEVGCAEAGFLEILHDLGMHVVGLELSESRVNLAKGKNPDLNVLVGDITDSRVVEQIGETFDLVVMRDVIEHVPDRISALGNIRELLKQGGYFYVTFPPRFSGFAGHQQNGRSLLRFVPFLHYLPNWLIRLLGKLFHERPELIENIILNFKVGLSIHAFEKYYRKFHFRPVVKELFLSRPIYRTRYNVSIRRLPNIPFLREFISFGCESLLQKID